MSISALSSTGSLSWEEMMQMTNARASQKSDDLGSKIFKDLDTDSNGAVSLKESGLSQETYDAMDTDKSGTVSLVEMEKAIELQRASMHTRMKLEGQEQTQSQAQAQTETGKPSAQGLLASILNGNPLAPAQGSFGGLNGAGANGEELFAKILADLDSDKSGGISSAESGLSQEIFDTLDLDKDGNVSAEEFASALEKQKTAMEQVGAKPTQSSSAGGSGGSGGGQAVFDAMDLNQDGTVSAEELATAKAQQQANGSNNSPFGTSQATNAEKAQTLLAKLANSAYTLSAGSGSRSSSQGLNIAV